VTVDSDDSYLDIAPMPKFREKDSSSTLKIGCFDECATSF